MTSDSALLAQAHTFHVCTATGPCAACGHHSLDIWLIREEWMDRLAPESLCDECLAALRTQSSGASSSSSARDAYSFRTRIDAFELKPA